VLKDLKQIYLDFVKTHYLGALATTGPDGAQCSTIYFATDPQGHPLFATVRETTKVKNIATQSRVALAVHDPEGKLANGIQLQGVATLLHDPMAINDAKQRLSALSEHIKRYLEQPDLLFFRIEVSSVYLLNFSWGRDWRVQITDF